MNVSLRTGRVVDEAADADAAPTHVIHCRACDRKLMAVSYPVGSASSWKAW